MTKEELEILIGSTWEKPEYYFDDIEVSPGCLVSSVGIYTHHKEHTSCIVTGSAIEINSDEDSKQKAFIRASFELLERIAIVEHTGFTTHDKSSQVRYIPSRSNGIAAHVTKELAKKSAYSELIERDQLLKSWFGEVQPEKIKEPLLLSATKALHGMYDFESYSFGEGVAGCFGFPKEEQFPVLYGFGMSEVSMEEAVIHAEKESLQRYVFLRDEELVSWNDDMSSQPNIEMHMNAFLHKSSTPRLKQWLNGEHSRSISKFARFTPAEVKSNSEIEYIDITPTRWQNHCVVVQCKDIHKRQLVFGWEHPQYQTQPGIPPLWMLHPFC